jgi:hypothetical protein
MHAPQEHAQIVVLIQLLVGRYVAMPIVMHLLQEAMAEHVLRVQPEKRAGFVMFVDRNYEGGLFKNQEVCL